ncbi:8164_t:CDS:1, partial [Ambispora leptoticha]
VPSIITNTSLPNITNWILCTPDLILPFEYNHEQAEIEKVEKLFDFNN